MRLSVISGYLFLPTVHRYIRYILYVSNIAQLISIVKQFRCCCMVVLSGHARSIKWDTADRVIILTLLKKGSEIGVLLAAQPEKESPVSVQALDEASVLMIPYDRVLAPV